MIRRGSYPENMVFGLDIGTRSIVGTVGYMDGERFTVIGHRSKEHKTRAMMDGQIHDIAQVGATIKEVKTSLEKDLGITLKDVCIAAAGRVLETISTHVDYEMEEEKIITGEDIYNLESLGVTHAYEVFQEKNETDLKFYCVGYSVVKYYLNGYQTTNLEHHKAKTISLDIIATFLPDDVVEGLYAAVKEADLEVANLTLEPIAAIRLAIPERFRMLNIALVDVGAGTSDICITQDGSIIAYGMIPCAGDSLTETVARHCLVDFATAEQIKLAIETEEEVSYEDIMGLTQKITRKEVLNVLKNDIAHMAKLVADEIKSLNGGTSTSAAFIVGGGGKIAGYTNALAKELGIAKDRVALRGKEVMNEIDFCDDVEKDPLLVTPLGICLCYYEQSNNFAFVHFNGERIKLYDNRKLSIVDAVMQVQYPSENLFPKRGEALEFYVDGKERMVRGEPGESAVILLNGEAVDMNTRIRGNDRIDITASTVGTPGKLEIGKLPEFRGTLQIHVNDRKITVPKFASVNGRLESEYYEIQQQDRIEMLSFYTVRQLAVFMDVDLEEYDKIMVNNMPANPDTEVYENFTVKWDMEDEVPDYEDALDTEEDAETENLENESEQETPSQTGKEQEVHRMMQKAEADTDSKEKEAQEPKELTVIVNDSPVYMKGKAVYHFVDIFEYIDFDTSKMQGNGIVTTINGQDAQYTEELNMGDKIAVYWKK